LAICPENTPKVDQVRKSRLARNVFPALPPQGGLFALRRPWRRMTVQPCLLRPTCLGDIAVSTRIKLIVAVLVGMLVLPAAAPAQWRDGPRRGLFGDRELGKPLQPRANRFGSGVTRGPSGNFLGLDRSTTERGSTFQARSRVQPQPTIELPPEAYDLEPDMVPGYLEEQARRMAAARQQQQPLPNQQPLVITPRPERYVPPAMPPARPPALPPRSDFPPVRPGVPGPTQQAPPSQPDRWFRGSAPAQPGQPMPGAATQPQRYVPGATLGPPAALGPAGVATPPAMSPLGTRITRQLGPSALSTITAIKQGNLVTLRGRVATEADRRLAEQMARSEPGVRAVVNQLRVEPAAPAPQQP